MNVLPRFLYLFQNVTIEISIRTFQELNKMISRLIWQGKRPIVRYKFLQLSREKEGFSLLNIQKYYKAVQKKILVNICNPSYKAKWKTVDGQTLSVLPLQVIIADSELVHYLKETNP